MNLYQISLAVLDLQETLDNLEGVDIPEELTQEYQALLEDREETNELFFHKVDSILAVIQTKKKWVEVRKEEAARLTKLAKKDEKELEWLTNYLKQHLEKVGIKKLKTTRFNLAIKMASVAPLHIFEEDPNKYPSKFQKMTIAIDKTALKDAVIKGDQEALKYAVLGERKNYLSLK